MKYRLQHRRGFTFINWSIQEQNKLIFTVRVEKTNPVIVTASVIAGLIIATSVVAWLTLDKVYQVMEAPAGQVLVGGVGAIALAVAIALILPMFKKG